MEDVNKKSVEMLSEIRQELENPPDTKMVLVGRVGPRGDGYFPDKNNLVSIQQMLSKKSQKTWPVFLNGFQW